MSAKPWRRVAFTTYSLSLAFFEGVILERLIRGGGRHATIFSDPEGIRAALQEQGARGAGRDYELEPISGVTGVFHPKVSVFAAQDDCHLIVGSGNLTFGGWGNNLENFEHLHPSFAADAFEDAAELFEYLSISDAVRVGSPHKLLPIANELRRASASGDRNGDIRLLSSLTATIGDQLASLASELGGARSLAVVSPYFDPMGLGVEYLIEKLGCETASVHVHPDGSVLGTFGTNWPKSARVRAVTVGSPFVPDGRKLHAKCYEIVCRRGRLLVSGSANATRSALGLGNVETVVVRIQREQIAGWSMDATSPPVHFSEAKEETSDDPQIEVLTASLEAGALTGLVFTPKIVGPAGVRIQLANGDVSLGTAIIAADGRFSIPAEALDSVSWSGGRMIAVIEKDGITAKGFVAFGAALEIVRRSGALAPRIFSLLSGTETPEDAAAVLSWFYANPELIAPTPSANYGGGDELPLQNVLITSEMLQGAVEGEFAGSGFAPSGRNDAWERAIHQLFQAFRTDHSAWKDEDDDQLPDNEELSSALDQEQHRISNARRQDAKDSLRGIYEALLNQMLADHHKGRHAANALALGLYLVARVRPPTNVARSWLARSLRAYTGLALSEDKMAMTTALLVFACQTGRDGVVKARKYFIERRVDPDRIELDTTSLDEAITHLNPGWNAPAFLFEVQHTRTASEEVRDFIADSKARLTNREYPILMQTKHWRRLDEARQDAGKLARLLITAEGTSCPRCHLALSSMARDQLTNTGVTECCRLILRTQKP